MVTALAVAFKRAPLGYVRQGHETPSALRPSNHMPTSIDVFAKAREHERLEQLKLEETGAALDLLTVGTREGAARANIAAYGRFLGRSLPAAALATVQSAFEASSH